MWFHFNIPQQSITPSVAHRNEFRKDVLNVPIDIAQLLEYPSGLTDSLRVLSQFDQHQLSNVGVIFEILSAVDVLAVVETMQLVWRYLQKRDTKSNVDVNIWQFYLLVRQIVQYVLCGQIP